MISECYLIEPFACNEDTPLAEIAKKLKEFSQRHIYVVDSENKPVGLVSITDILDKVVIPAKNVADLTAKDIMTTEILVYDDNTKVKEAYKAMVDKGVVSCAVTEEGKLIGILSLKEAIKQITNPEKVVQN